jgi:hypothetical protein
MRTEDVWTTALLALQLYGRDVVFDGPDAINRFLSGSSLYDKPLWRESLLLAHDLSLAPIQ